MTAVALESALPIIRPITDLRTNLNDVCAQAKETQEPLILTKNGRASLVLIDSDAYEAKLQRDRMYLAIREAEIEQRFENTTISEDEANERMKRIFAQWGIDYD